MAQKTTQISLGTAEVAALQHVLAQAQAKVIEDVGRKDVTLGRIETKIAEAVAKAAVKAAPNGGDDTDAGKPDES
jgi:hypothetical protein